MGKTGTTALQIAFTRNRELLRDHGIEYPEHESDHDAVRGNVVSGNGLGIISYMAPLADVSMQATAGAHDRLTKAVSESRCPTVLYSSELLYNFRSDRLKELVDEFSEAGIAVDVVLYLRDVAGHALSSYSQDVKRGLYAGTVSDYLSRPYAPRMSARISSLIQIVGQEHLHVYRWDSHRSRLVQHFFTEVLGLVNADGISVERQNVNRSLTRAELDAMRFMNRSLSGKKAARVVSDALISGPPVGEVKREVTEGEVEVLEERFRSELDWINEAVLPGDNLQLVGDVAIVDAHSQDEEFSARELRVMECLVHVANSFAAAESRK